MKAKKKAPPVLPAPDHRTGVQFDNLVKTSSPEPLSRKQQLKFPTSLDEIEGLSEPDLAIWAGLASELARALWLERARRKNLKDPQLQGLADMDRRTRNHVLVYLAKRDPELIPF